MYPRRAHGYSFDQHRQWQLQSDTTRVKDNEEWSGLQLKPASLLRKAKFLAEQSCLQLLFS
jgi:hypothetical protein